MVDAENGDHNGEGEAPSEGVVAEEVGDRDRIIPITQTHIAVNGLMERP